MLNPPFLLLSHLSTPGPLSTSSLWSLPLLPVSLLLILLSLSPSLPHIPCPQSPSLPLSGRYYSHVWVDVSFLLLSLQHQNLLTCYHWLQLCMSFICCFVSSSFAFWCVWGTFAMQCVYCESGLIDGTLLLWKTNWKRSMTCINTTVKIYTFTS